MKTGVKRFLIVAGVLVVLGILMSICSKKSESHPDCQHDDTTFNCVEYLRNYDGDTVAFNIPHVHPLLGHDINVRLTNVDAPEIKTINICEKKVALKAKEFVESQLVNATRIDLHNVKRDKYFRIDADIVVNGKSLSQLLLDKNMAYPYHGGHKPDFDWCQFALPWKGM